MRNSRRFKCYLVMTLALTMAGCTISSTPGTQTPESLSIAPANPSLPLGLSQTFFAIAQLHDGSSQDVTSLTQWTSSNTAVATIDKKGNLQTLAKGTTQVTAAYGSLTANTTVTVTPPGVIAVNISPASPGPIQIGNTLQFTATGTMSDGSPSPDITGKVAWTSSNSGVASIISGGSQAGLTTANTVGVTVITATYGSGQNAPAGFVTLVVNPVLNSITVRPSAADIATSTNQQFTATGFYNDGSTQDITAQSSTQWTLACTPSNVATINAGLAKATSTTGSCTVTATSGSVNGAGTLTVSAFALSQLAITPAVPKSPTGVPIQFTATGQFTGGSIQDLTSAPGIKWTSSNTAVAAKPNNGKTSTVAAGTSTIQAQFSATQAPTTLTVSSVKLSSISLTTPLTKMGEGTYQQLTATGKFSDNSTQDLTGAVTWKSSAPVLSVSSSGFVTSNFPGSTTITASLDGVTATTPSIQVNAVVTKSVAITPTSAGIAPGTTQTFTATATFTDGTKQDITRLVQWNSSDASAATIQDFGANAGVATAVASGTSNISAVFGSVNASTSSLTVSSATPTALTITPGTPSLALGTSQQMKATMSLSDLSSQDVTNIVTWSSTTIATAVVSSSGLVVSAGTNGGTPTTIKATFNIPGGGTQVGTTTVTVH